MESSKDDAIQNLLVLGSHIEDGYAIPEGCAELSAQKGEEDELVCMLECSVMYKWACVRDENVWGEVRRDLPSYLNQRRVIVDVLVAVQVTITRCHQTTKRQGDTYR